MRTPHQDRVLDELDQLSERMAKLRAFVDAPHFATLVAPRERDLLVAQLAAMAAYRTILDLRVGLWSAE